MLAIIEAYSAGLLKKQNWLPNIIAGLIVAIVALPLAMAFAIASGVKPEQGLYTAIIAGLFVGIFGGSRVQIAGPTGAFIVILANITAQYGINGLQIASILAGFILIFMGIAKLGNVIKFIPNPVIVGFTSGIGMIIFVGEWKDFFGLSIHLPLNSYFFDKLIKLVFTLPHFDIATTLLACFSLFLVIISPYFFKKIPGPLIAMIFATGIQAIFHFKSIATIGSTFGSIPSQLPPFHWPSMSFDRCLDLVEPAFTIALLGAIESLLSATAADVMAGTRHNSNQELIGQGLANICAPLFNGFAATGAIARTATNVRNGGTNLISSITHSLILLLVLLLLAPLAANIPLCCLAAILFVVAYNMSDIPHFIQMLKKAPLYDVVVLLITFVLTVFINLVVAVNVGVILSILFFIRRMYQSTHIEEQDAEKLKLEFSSEKYHTMFDNTMIYSIEGPLFFGVAEKIELALASKQNQPEVIIFRLKQVPFMDITGLETFKELIKNYYQDGVKVYLCEANEKVAHKIQKVGILQWIAESHIFNELNDALNLLIMRSNRTASRSTI